MISKILTFPISDWGSSEILVRIKFYKGEMKLNDSSKTLKISVTTHKV